MKHFVIAYHRLTHAVTTREFDDGAAALDFRFALERETSDPDMEIASFGAESLDALKMTHGRYFLSPVELSRRDRRGHWSRRLLPR